MRCAALVAEVAGPHQQQLTQTLIMRLLKTHFFTPILDFKSQQKRELVTIAGTVAGTSSPRCRLGVRFFKVRRKIILHTCTWLSNY